MTNIYFITEDFIKNNSPVTSNIDPKDLFPHVQSAQQLFLQVILGSEFYIDLLTKFEAQTLSADEITLVENYIKPATLWRSLVLSLPWIHYNLRNKGFMQNTDDNATSAGFNELKFMLNETKNRAEFTENQLTKYLCENSSLFPLYTTQDGLIDPDTSTNWDSGLVMY
tara:strand:- start:212 stop:715 length:504 start_codon:yes stop_codon:yes gene_type:complete